MLSVCFSPDGSSIASRVKRFRDSLVVHFHGRLRVHPIWAHQFSVLCLLLSRWAQSGILLKRSFYLHMVSVDGLVREHPYRPYRPRILNLLLSGWKQLSFGLCRSHGTTLENVVSIYWILHKGIHRAHRFGLRSAFRNLLRIGIVGSYRSNMVCFKGIRFEY